MKITHAFNNHINSQHWTASKYFFFFSGSSSILRYVNSGAGRVCVCVLG